MARLFVFLATLAFSVAAQANTPLETIKAIDRRFELESTNLDGRELKRSILENSFDLENFCRFILAVHWERRTELERTDFIDLMRTLLERKTLFTKEYAVQQTHEEFTIHYQGETYLDQDKTHALSQTRVMTSCTSSSATRSAPGSRARL